VRPGRRRRHTSAAWAQRAAGPVFFKEAGPRCVYHRTMKGGARSQSGPVPDMAALARGRDGADWVRLSAAGRTKDAPEWPPEVEEPSVAEIALWHRLWRKPQALVWEADHASDTVALYVRTYIASMERGCAAAMITHAKTLAGELLLTPESLARGKYVIKGTPEEEALNAAVARHPAGGSPGAPRGGSAKTRLTVVPSAEGGEPAEDPEPDEDEIVDDDPPPF
jgi:hypothetical protein